MSKAKCGKLRFSSREAAEAAARKVRVSPVGLVPLKVYRCGPCRAWHYSSKGRRKSR